MKKTSMKSMTTVVLAAVFLTACTQGNDGYTVTGKIGGLPDGTVVILKNIELNEDNRGVVIATDTVKNGLFRLQGRVEAPTLCRMAIPTKAKFEDGTEYNQETSTLLWLSNETLTIEAAHLDSLPLIWEFGHSPLEKERNVTVKGGKLMQEYNDYRDALYPLELAAWQLEHKAWVWTWRNFTEKREECNTDSVAYYTELARKANETVSEAKDCFIADHPDYAFSVYLTEQKAKVPFSYTAAELDEMVARVASASDTLRLARLRESAETMKACAKGIPYFDFTFLSEQGEEKHFEEFVKPGTCTLVDFWASWCGPCRMAIPHVKELAAKYDGVLTVLSVSLDKKEADWKEALQQEKMPWAQGIVPKEKEKAAFIYDAYRFNSIPYLLLVGPDGTIECATHDANVMTGALEKLIP